MPDFAVTELPLAPYLPAIVAKIRESGRLLLAAEPGAGKTSLVPLALMGEIGGRIIVLEPRRLAAVAAAERMADLLGERVGRRIGYRVRNETKVGPSSRVEVMTNGVLLRMIQDDPGLAGVGCIVFDEFHERSLQADLCMAFVLDVQALRPDLVLMAMSATLDTDRVAAFLDAPLLSVPGRAFPVRTRYATVGDGPGFEDRFARLAAALADEAEGDVLVFLPGAAEIGRTAAALRGMTGADGGIEVLPLHGSLPLEAQRRVMGRSAGGTGDDVPKMRRRLILATSVAETSLTVPGVRAVLDSGLARLSRFHVRTGLNRLVTEREAQDRADQRRGRAGRLGPGLCLRAWPAGEVLSARTEAEILRAELSGLVLEAAVWGARTPGDLPWLDAPPLPLWDAGRELLTELGALDPHGAPTDLGRQMARLGAEPRLAALVLRGAAAGRGWTACLTAALITERESQTLREERDLDARLEALRGGAAGPTTSRSMMEAHRLAVVAGIRRPARGEAEQPKEGLGPLLAAAFPDRIGKRFEYRGKDASFRLPSGRALRAAGSLAAAPWIVATDADAGAAEGKVFAGSALAESNALAALGPIIAESLEIEWKGLSYRARRQRRAGAIVLSETAVGALPPDRIGASLAARIAAEGLGILPWGDASSYGDARAFLARLRYWAALRRAKSGAKTAPEGLPDLDDASLAASAAEWLIPFIATGPASVLDGRGLRRALESLLPQRLKAELEREAPERLELPSGSSRPLEYSETGEISLEARVQELFGLAEHPRICGRPVLVRLLSPAGRPVQTTSDLPGFWRGGWAELRKELRGRYPKHDWPEDPLTATPKRSGLKSR